MGNLGKATSFVDPEGDGDVMPKLVDMLTKVGGRLTIVFMRVVVIVFKQFHRKNCNFQNFPSGI